jgi:hypothetical protein
LNFCTKPLSWWTPISITITPYIKLLRLRLLTCVERSASVLRLLRLPVCPKPCTALRQTPARKLASNPGVALPESSCCCPLLSSPSLLLPLLVSRSVPAVFPAVASAPAAAAVGDTAPPHLDRHVHREASGEGVRLPLLGACPSECGVPSKLLLLPLCCTLYDIRRDGVMSGRTVESSTWQLSTVLVVVLVLLLAAAAVPACAASGRGNPPPAFCFSLQNKRAMQTQQK